MPKFVPVMDTEKPLCEQKPDHASLAKHRRFDNPHSLHAEGSGSNKKTVDRGWQQGNVGWGVLGSFGSSGKDEIAQVVRRAEGSNKMVKNSKGLWVKQSQTEIIPTPQGRGRGGGIPVFNADISSKLQAKATSHSERENDRGFKEDRDVDDFGRARYQTYDESERGSDRRRERSRSRDRDRNSRHDHDRRDRGESRDDRFRDRSRSRDNDRRHRNFQDDSYTRRNKAGDRDRESGSRREKVSAREREQMDAEKDPKKEEEEEEEEREGEEVAEGFEVTAVQVVNRFHEVYAKETLFQQDRIDAISELFAEDARISSLKSGSQYLQGRAAIAESFRKTVASPVEVSKRLFVEPVSSTEAATTTAASSSSSSSSSLSSPSAPACSFLLDLHRAGSAPGLGDKSKDAALLYRVQGALITGIWGAAESEQQARDPQLSREQLLLGRTWRLARDLVQRERPLDAQASQAHYHNYDQMETWG